MNVSTLLKSLLLYSICLFASLIQAQDNTPAEIDFNQLSIKFLNELREGKSTEHSREQLKNTSLEALERGLQTDREKLAFWINIYNAYILAILNENPDLYKDRRSFFKKEQIPIAGKMLSFSKIEHGIIRKSQWELGLGYIRKWFPDRFERKLRVDQRDYRIHFALNCGARDCPPVGIYTADRLVEQLDKGTETYLKRTSKYDDTAKVVTVTPLFKWFKGDFGCKKGIREILHENGIIPENKEIEITYDDYDWTLHLNNFTDL